MRGSVMESTMVSGIGQGGDGQGPGSGEVRLNRLDDVHIPGGSGTTFGTRTVAAAGANVPNHGDILIWDETIYPNGGWTTTPGRWNWWWYRRPIRTGSYLWTTLVQ